MLACLALACLTAEARAQTSIAPPRGGSAVAGEIRGRLEGVVMPLAYAVIEATSRGVRRTTTADASGRYAFGALEPGDVTLSVTHVGYQPLAITVTVPIQTTVTVDLELTAVPLPLPPVDVLGGATPLDRALDAVDRGPALAEVDLQALEVGPGVGQAGLADVVAALPGNDPGDATDILFLRGSTADLKLVLLDGVPVYTPFHVAGLMKSFEQSVLGGADLHVGGAPARFDGGLTNILELRTRAARRDRLRLSGAADLLAASAAIEAPVGSRVGVIASARALHGLGDAPLGGASPYGYHDALVSTAAEPGAGHELRATGFWNEESVRLDASRAPGSARWSTGAGSTSYRATWEGARLDLTGGLSVYRADLPLQPGLPSGSMPWAPLPPALLASAATNRMRAVGELTWGRPVAPVRAGISFERIEERFEARPVTGGPSSELRGSGSVVGAFLDITRPIGDGLSLRAGSRVDDFGSGRVLFAPRAAVSWEVGPRALLTVAAGRYHQPTRSADTQVEQTLEGLAAGGRTVEARLAVASADHIVLGLDQRLTQDVRIGLEGFWKLYRNLPSTGADAVRSSGVDLRIVTAGERRSAWLGYGLAWFWSSMDLSGSSSEFVGRHLLSAGVSGRLLGPIDAEARVAYGAGLPYTSIPFRSGTETDAVSLAVPRSATVNQISQMGRPDGTPGLDAPLDDTFLRVDVELHTVFEPTWGGHPWRVRPYIRILNALDRRDALFYSYQPWRSDEVMPLAERPMIPLVGLAFSF